jgi:hypothetical protein
MLIAGLCACGPKAGHTIDSGTGSSGDDDAAPPVSMDAPGPDASCGEQQQQIGVVNLGDPPDLLIVLDRSGSMRDVPITFPPVFTSKWDIMHTALDDISVAKDQAIKFGLLEFPSDDNCAADAIPEVPIQLGASSSIAGYFQNRMPDGNTPAYIALGSALAYFNSIPVNPAGRYVLFATDGLPNCGGVPPDPNTTSSPETVAAVTALAAAGIKTYVIGFGTFGLNTGVLDDAATAGGEARPGEPKFYEANNAADLTSALQTISGGIIVPTCTYQLQSAPPDPNNVTVTLNGVPVGRSTAHTTGWDYYPDAMTITFFGSTCSQIMSGAVSDVSFAYGCPGPIIN